MDIKKIKQLIGILQDSDLDELEVTEKGSSLRLVKNRKSEQVNYAPPPQSMAPAPADIKPAVEEAIESGHTVCSPMVGTFYSAAAPGKPPFVKEGDIIKEGDTICIVEAMKTMNKIKSDKSGRVKKMPVDDGMPVEYNQVLCIIE